MLFEHITDNNILKLREWLQKRGFLSSDYAGLEYKYKADYFQERKKRFEVTVNLLVGKLTVIIDDEKYRKLNPYQPKDISMCYEWSNIQEVDLLIHNIDKFIKTSLERIEVKW